MKLSRTAGSTSQILQVFIKDSSSATGAGKTGLTNTSITAYFHRDVDTTATAISVVTMTVGTFTSGGFKEIDSANMPGMYQFCPPNTALASGATSTAILIKDAGSNNVTPTAIEIDLASTIIVTTNNDKTGYTASTVSDKTGYSLSSTGLNSVVTAEPSGPPAWGNTIPAAISWIMCLARNKITQTASVQTLINDAASTISTSAVSDDGTTFQRSKWS